MRLDHVLFAVPDLESAAADFEARHGLASVEGGRHPGWGTANRIVPLGDSYVELIAVVDEDVAARSGVGSLVATAAAGDGRLLGWAVGTDDLDGVAARLRLDVQPGSRVRPDGTELHWRIAGFEQAFAGPFLPFFIEWAEGTSLPGQAATQSRAIASLVLSGDPERLSSWLGPHDLPISIAPGEAGIVSLELRDACGESVVIGG